MVTIENNIIVEIERKNNISFNKRFKNFLDSSGKETSLNISQLRKDVAEYLFYNKERYDGQRIFTIVYDYDLNVCITLMKDSPDYDIYTILGIALMERPEDSVESDEEKQETIKIGKEIVL